MKGENIVSLFHFLWYILRNTQSGGARRKKNFLENIKISWAINLSLLINSHDVVSEQAQMSNGMARKVQRSCCCGMLNIVSNIRCICYF
ncbi:hypothetical protein T12_14669 [Trichinella patagoniensis]|uniref:Uncharacterized protein n=1 Tax=Trichinella patagoniensis TaxID=990121 RepID=A0A0V0Z3V7_9BILA|nr:hypothetical protein T12_4981 [Trichinella patagoniensis]KRY07079.1 hypothetical protein T12_2671 [Trichinella patagoniensis]KRY12987.1 hypothetical protein T12_14669 [Trichinella patagoniensis]